MLSVIEMNHRHYGLKPAFASCFTLIHHFRIDFYSEIEDPKYTHGIQKMVVPKIPFVFDHI